MPDDVSDLLDAPVAALAARVVSGVEEVLGTLGAPASGVHVVGARALGSREPSAPLELVVVTADRWSAGTLDAGRLAAWEGWHAHLAAEVSSDTAPGVPVGVVYAPAADLRSPMTVGRSWLQVAPGSGELSASPAPHTLRLRWVLRERGVALRGQSARQLVAPVDVGALRAEMIGLARTLAESLEEDPSRFDDPARATALVGTLCQALHTTHTAEVTHRDAALAWAEQAFATGPTNEDGLRTLVQRVRSGRPLDRASVRSFTWEVHRLVGAEALRRRDG